MARRPGLDGVMLKIRRADECLAFLDDQRRSLLEATGNRVVGEFETGSGDCVFRVTGEPPLDWGIPIGEYAHALRSALDNLLWQLILARGGTPTKTTQWPIYEDEAKSIAKASGRTKIQAQTDGVLGEDLEFIEGHQPNKMGRDLARWHPFALLGHLNNVDKHQVIHAAFAAAAMVPAGGPYAGRPFLQCHAAAGFIRSGAVNPTPVRTDARGNSFHEFNFSSAGTSGPKFPLDGSITSRHGHVHSYSFEGSDQDPTEVGRAFGVSPNIPNAKMEMDPSFLLDISFSDRERPMTIFDLHDIRAAVQEVVERFRPVIE